MCRDCMVCTRNRGRAIKGLQGSPEAYAGPDVAPWEKVIVDIEGPYAPAGENGHRYILTYRCKAIRASILECLPRLTRPRFARAFLNCVFRWRRLPRVIYSDRGPEVRNAMIRELFRYHGSTKARRPAQPTSIPKPSRAGPFGVKNYPHLHPSRCRRSVPPGVGILRSCL